SGQPLYRAANVQDLTERTIAESRLAESEQRFRLLSEVAPVGVYLTDADGNCTFVNRRWREMAGVDLETARAEGWKAALHPEDRESVFNSWSTMIESEGQWGLEYRMQQPGGSITWVYGLAAAIRDEEGHVTGYVGANIDITQRRKSEDLLRQKEAQLSTILETSPDRIWLLDSRLNVLFGNLAALGRNDKIIGESVLSTLIPERRKDVRLHLEKALRSKSSYRYEAKIEETDGTESIFDNVAVPIREDGRVDGLVIVSRDVTLDRHKAFHDQHAERLAAIGKLAAGIAHDFNNVMGVISLYTNLLMKEGGLTSKAKGRLATILENCDQAKNLTQQILDYGRKGVLDRNPTDLSQLLSQMFRTLGHGFSRDITLTPVLGTNIPLVNVDPGRIRQAILNLALNARDSMPDGGELRIELDEIHIDSIRDAPVPGMPLGTWVGITVNDTGHGIKKNQIDRIFEPFFTTKPPESGTGLGLSQVYGIIKQHGGHIDVDSTEGKGTTFYLYLPAL
ncbi:PAS domain S-box protein, partial [Rhodothermus sp. AH-315-K08]|nr:PAS domain S-box protein [Rhodothermus sp. AH-315-K08]